MMLCANCNFILLYIIIMDFKKMVIITYAYRNIIGGIEKVNALISEYFSNKYLVKYLILYEKIKSDETYYYIDDINDIIEKNNNIDITIYTSFDIIKYLDKQHYDKVRLIGISHSDILYHNMHFIQYHKMYKKIICINNHTYHKYLKKGIYNVEYIPNTIECVRDPVKKKHDGIKLLYYSRSSNDKNIIMLMHAVDNLMKNNPDIIMDIYSSFDNNHMYYYNLLTHKNKINLFDFNNKHDIYLDYDITLLSSVSEGCSLNVLESINYGTPIICTNCVGNKEIIHDMLPMFELDDINVCMDDDYILNYNKLLTSIGYVFDMQHNIKVPDITDVESYNKYNKNLLEIENKIWMVMNDLTLYKLKTVELKKYITHNHYDIDYYLNRLDEIFFDKI